MANPFKRRKEPEYDEDEIQPEEEDDYEDFPEPEPRRIKRRPPITTDERKKDRYTIGYQKEVLCIIDHENPDRHPEESEYYRESTSLLQSYPDLKVYVKELNDLDKIRKSVR